MSNKSLLYTSFDALIEEISPQKLIEQRCQLKGHTLIVSDQQYNLDKYKKIYLLGSGKAVIPMAKAMHALLRSYISQTLIIGSYDCTDKFENCLYFKSTHPLPSQKSVQAAKSLQTVMSTLGEDDLFIYLLSGGNSAMVEWPEKGISLKEFQEATSIMLDNGMPIEKMNCVRKHISQVKGGKLAKKTKATGLVLVLSDVIGDDLHSIGSAPLYCDNTNFYDAVSYLKEYRIFEQLPQSIQVFLKEGEAGSHEETPDMPEANIKHFILGSNGLVLEKAKQILETKGIYSTVMNRPLQGDCDNLAKELLAYAKQHKGKRHCYIFGGKARVLPKSEGKGGRNQHLCLSVLKELDADIDLTFLSAATDGIDGNSQAAGAIIDTNSQAYARKHDINAQDYLDTFNSNGFFAQTKELIITGPTHNNLLDIVIMLIEERSKQ